MTAILRFILLTLLTTSFTPASEEILKCLGSEELSFHQKKLQGPSYHLNQLLISEILSERSFNIWPKYLNEICKEKTSVSIKLIEKLLITEKALLKTSSYNSQIFDKAPHIFFNYLSRLQSKSSYAHCLDEAIKEIPYFMERYKYLEENYDKGQLLNDKRKIKTIFKKLRNLKSIYASCEKKQRAIEKKIKTVN